MVPKFGKKVNKYTILQIHRFPFQAYSLGPSVPINIGVGRMISINAGTSAILFGYGKNPTPIFKLTCNNADPGQCQWKQLDYSLPFQANLPVAMLIPDEI